MSFTETHYVTQNGAGTRSGRNLSNAWSLADFQSSANWSTYNSVDEKIGPGDVVYFSGTFTSRPIVTLGGNPDGSVTLDGFEAGETNPIQSVNTDTALLLQGMDIGNGVAGPDYLTIQDFRMTRNNSIEPCFRLYADRYGATEDLRKIDHAIIRRNYVYQTNGTMFYWFGGRYSIIEGNKFVHFGQNGTDATQGVNLIELHNSVIAGNEFGHNEAAYPSGCTSAEMVELHGCQHLLMEYNSIYGAPKQSGIRPKEWGPMGNYNIVIRFNKIHGNKRTTTGYGICTHTNISELLSNFYIYGNNLYDNTSGIAIGLQVANVYVWANLIHNNTRYGVVVWDASDNLHFINNTIARNNTSNETDISRGGIVLSKGTNVHVKNNLLWNNRAAGERDRMQIYVKNTLSSLEHNHYYHALGAPTVYYDSANRTLATLKSSYNFEDDAPAGSITNPLFVFPSGVDGTHGTEDDNYRLSVSSPLIGAGKTLTGSFSVNISGGDSWLETQSGYSTLSFGLDDALDPIGTDWTTNPPTVVSAKQGAYGDWEPGAYIYRTEDPEDPPEEPGEPDTFLYDPRAKMVGTDPLSTDWTVNNRSVSAIDISEIVKTHTPFGIKAWRLRDAERGSRVFQYSGLTTDAYEQDILVLYRPTHNSETQLYPMGRMEAVTVDGYGGGVRDALTLRMFKFSSNSSSTLLDVNHELSSVAGQWLWTRFSLIGTALKTKTWVYGDAEPATWQAEVADSLHAIGKVGFYLWLDGVNATDPTIDIAWFSVGIEGDIAPSPTIWTVKQSGGNYSSLATALANASLGEYDVINIEREWTADDTAPATVTDAGIFINAIGESKVDPSNLSSSTHYRLRCATNGSHCFIASTANVAFRGLEICQESTGSSDECVRNSNAGILNIYDSVLWCKTAVGMQDCIFTNTPNSTIEIENTKIFGAGRCGVNSQAPSGTTVLNINSCSIYGCAAHADFDQQKGGINILYPSGTTVYVNIFNSIVMGSINLDDTDYHGDFGISTNSADRAGTAYWNIHNCIGSDDTIDLRDASAHGCLTERTATDNASPGAGNWVVFEGITALPYDLRLKLFTENDAINMHSDLSGAGMGLPSYDILGTPRPTADDVDCGAFELFYFFTTLAPTTVAPTTLISTTLVPTTLSPTTLVPTTEVPTTLAPTLSPTTVLSTTLSSTTLTPTTLSPTTLSPTTVVPTTLSPTTLLPTTLASTTVLPTTSTPTTLLPTTLLPTTLVPTTLTLTTLAPTTLEPGVITEIELPTIYLYSPILLDAKYRVSLEIDNE